MQMIAVGTPHGEQNYGDVGGAKPPGTPEHWLNGERNLEFSSVPETVAIGGNDVEQVWTGMQVCVVRFVGGDCLAPNRVQIRPVCI